MLILRAEKKSFFGQFAPPPPSKDFQIRPKRSSTRLVEKILAILFFHTVGNSFTAKPRVWDV